MSRLFNYLPGKPVGAFGESRVPHEPRSPKTRGATRSSDRSRRVRSATAKPGRRAAITPIETLNTVAIYVRQQTGKVADIIEQLRQCHECAADRNLCVVRTYYDEGSANLDLSLRPGLRAMLADAREQKFDAVLTEDGARLSRDIAKLTVLLRNFHSLRVEVVTVSGGEPLGSRRTNWIFREYLKGMTTAEIAKRLNAEGIL